MRHGVRFGKGEYRVSLSVEGVEAESTPGVEIEVLHLRVHTSEPEGFFSMTCTLPPQWGLVQYAVREL